MGKPDPIEYRLMPAGRAFVVMGVLLAIGMIWQPGFAAPVLACWLAIGTLQLLWPRLALRNVEVRFLPPPRAVRARENIQLALEIRNTSTWLRLGPMFFHSAITGRVTGLQPQEVLDVPQPGEARVVHVGFGVANRGRHHAFCEAIETLHPFALIATARRTPELAVPLIAWCARLSAAPLRASTAALPPRSAAADRRRTRRGNEDQALLRSYQPGDPARMIHWRLSARAQELIVVERQPRPEPRFWLCLDTGPGCWPRSALFERALQLATTLAEDHFARGSLRGIVLNGRSRRISDRHSLGVALDSLADLRVNAGTVIRRRKTRAVEAVDIAIRRPDILDLLPSGANTVRVADVHGRTVLEI